MADHKSNAPPAGGQQQTTVTTTQTQPAKPKTDVEEKSGGGQRVGMPASESGTPDRDPNAPPPELQGHQKRPDGTPGAEPPIVGGDQKTGGQ